jgi:uncharacterized membrane protein YuzA (DUF378 family)
MGFDLFRIALLLLVVGGLNWGSVGLLGKDLVVMLLGRGAASKAVYVLVGLAALFVGLRMFGFAEGFEDNNNKVIIYADCNYKGASMVLEPKTWYAKDNLGPLYNAISSIKVPNGREVTINTTLRSDSGKIKIKKSNPCFSNMNDRAKSVFVV